MSDWIAVDDFKGIPDFNHEYEIKLTNEDVLRGRWNELACWFRCPTNDRGVLRVEIDEITHLRKISEEPMKLVCYSIKPKQGGK